MRDMKTTSQIIAEREHSRKKDHAIKAYIPESLYLDVEMIRNNRTKKQTLSSIIEAGLIRYVDEETVQRSETAPEIR